MQMTKIYFLLVLSALLLVSVLYAGFSDLGWHDQQRVYQSLLLCLAALFWLFNSPKHSVLASKTGLLFWLVLGLGLLSSLLAAYPVWALKEWGRYAGLLILVWLLAAYAQERWFATALLGLLALIAFLLAFQFLVLYSMAFVSGILRFDVDLFFSGFSNPRFMNQFQVLLMPMLAGLVVYLHGRAGNKPQRYARAGTWLLFAALTVHWCLALALGGRGFLLAVAVTHLALWLCLPRFRALVVVQAATALLGWGLYQLLFFVIPDYLGQGAVFQSVLRYGLSGRELIWGLAWRMFLEHPWLGVGPMHFSAQINPVAAHPHQVVLQWLAEWGIFATLAACTLIFSGMWRGWQFLRGESAQVIDAGLWLALGGALLLAQVDGVFVMPYTETWLAILAALALARWSKVSAQNSTLQQDGERTPERLFFMHIHKLLAVSVVLILGNVLLTDVPALMQQDKASTQMFRTMDKPRFWQHGEIP